MDSILEVRHLKKYFYFNTSGGALHAVDDISFSVGKGKTIGVVGESGCGKSTLGRVILGLLPVTDGQICFKGEDITRTRGRRRKRLRREMQMIFQDPFSSLDPRLCTAELIAEPLRIFRVCRTRDEEECRVKELMDTVGISAHMAYAYPHELDGGRRQRIGIARALALDPDFVVCDEPVSALDVSIQAQVLNLLKELQRDKGLAYMFITHDLSVVRHVSDDILVMYMGQMVEKAPAKELFCRPMHPYTRGLISAIPVPSLHRERRHILLKGEVTSPVDPEPGCRFLARCPYAKERCACEQPTLVECGPDHLTACHFIHEIHGS